MSGAAGPPSLTPGIKQCNVEISFSLNGSFDAVKMDQFANDSNIQNGDKEVFSTAQPWIVINGKHLYENRLFFPSIPKKELYKILPRV